MIFDQINSEKKMGSGAWRIFILCYVKTWRLSLNYSHRESKTKYNGNIYDKKHRSDIHTIILIKFTTPNLCLICISMSVIVKPGDKNRVSVQNNCLIFRVCNAIFSIIWLFNIQIFDMHNPWSFYTLYKENYHE